jgi:subtilisin family serine protease
MMLLASLVSAASSAPVRAVQDAGAKGGGGAAQPAVKPLPKDDAARAGNEPAVREAQDSRIEPMDLRLQRPKAEALESIAAQAAKHGSARVILGVPVLFVAEGQLAKAAVDEQRGTIARAQERLLDRLPGVQEVLHRYQTIPYVAVVLDAAGAEGLKGAEGVASAHLDRERAPSLGSTTPIIGATTAAARGFTGAGQTIAILDTGVDSGHPFLAGSVVDEACFGSCPNGGSVQFGPGAGIPLPPFVAGAFHGTHVAGIAAGRAIPSVSFAGVARGASIMAINVFHRLDNFWPFNFCGDDPSPCARVWDADAVAGLDHVFSRRGLFSIAAVNMSFGGGAFAGDCGGTAYDAAVSNLRSVGIATVAASGNEAFASALGAPACVPGVISVGATNDNDTVPNFSNSAPSLDFLAPGVSVVSSVPGGGFGAASGTSMAAPHVAGTFALLKQKWPAASVFVLEHTLRQTALNVLDGGSGIVTPRIRAARALAKPAVFDHDFTRDRAADQAVFRAWSHEWWIRGQGAPVLWGDPGDQAVPADYNGDGSTDIAVFRPATSQWWIRNQPVVLWGGVGDTAVPADYDGNGTADVAIWRPSDGTWWIAGMGGFQWGQAGDVPVPADYNNDGIADIAIWRPSTGVWHIRGQGAFQWGQAGDVPVPADYDGNGTADIAVWRPSNGAWFVLGQFTFQWGAPTDIPIPGSVGLGKAELTVWRPSTGMWHTVVRHPGNFLEFRAIQWGGAGDVPL